MSSDFYKFAKIFVQFYIIILLCFSSGTQEIHCKKNRKSWSVRGRLRQFIFFPLHLHFKFFMIFM